MMRSHYSLLTIHCCILRWKILLLSLCSVHDSSKWFDCNYVYHPPPRVDWQYSYHNRHAMKNTEEGTTPILVYCRRSCSWHHFQRWKVYRPHSIFFLQPYSLKSFSLFNIGQTSEGIRRWRAENVLGIFF